MFPSDGPVYCYCWASVLPSAGHTCCLQLPIAYTSVALRLPFPCLSHAFASLPIVPSSIRRSYHRLSFLSWTRCNCHNQQGASHNACIHKHFCTPVPIPAMLLLHTPSHYHTCSRCVGTLFNPFYSHPVAGVSKAFIIPGGKVWIRVNQNCLANQSQEECFACRCQCDVPEWLTS